METAIITVEYGMDKQRDLEVPLNITAKELLNILNMKLAMGSQTYSKMKILGKSSLLEEEQTLTEIGAWEGSIIKLL